MAMLAPIPGQSLTDEPNNFAWERPPEISDPNEAFRFHMDRLSEKPVAESVLFLMEYGYPVDVLTRSMLTSAVSEGIHSIDVSLILSPVIEEEMSYMARTAGIEYKDTFTADKTDDELQEEKLRSLILKKLDDNLGKGDDEFARQTLGALGSAGEDDLEAMQNSMSPEQEGEQQELMDSSSAEQGMVDEMESMGEETPAQTVGGMGLMSRGI
jgi:hypothetical protein